MMTYLDPWPLGEWLELNNTCPARKTTSPEQLDSWQFNGLHFGQAVDSMYYPESCFDCLCDFDNLGFFLKINDRKAEEMSLREAIDTVRRSNRLDLLVLKDDHLPPSYSTHSLPASFRNKSRDRDLPNGYGDEREPELPSRCVEKKDISVQ